MSALSSQPYKGSRDYYPEDKRLQNYIFSTWKKVVTSFGYEEYGAPLLEPLEVYAAKSGQELVSEQTYTFMDRGGRTVAIRPEMTPSISRMIAERRQEMAYPARLFSIANFMRYERPQKGREREFWQLNADIFGVDGSTSEAEIIIMASKIMKAFGATDKMFTIKINNRKLINFMMSQYLGLDAAQAQLMVKLFDRRTKISEEDFRFQAEEVFGSQDTLEGMKRVAALLSVQTVSDLPPEIRESSISSEIEELFKLLEQSGVKNAVFDVSLMRGLDYYTGTVFEVFDTDPENNRSLFGGGRYDGLVGMFGAEPISAVGIAPGLSTTELFLKTHDLVPELPSSTEIYLIGLGDTKSKINNFANELREEGVKVEVDITDRKIDKQIKTAVKKRIPFIIFVGPEEVSSRVYPLKNILTSEEQKLSPERIISTVKDHRHSRLRNEFDLS